MNQNENQFDSIYQQPFVQKNASYFRARARKLLTGNWGAAILIGFLALLLGGVISGSFSFNFNFSDFNIFADSEYGSYDSIDGAEFFADPLMLDFFWVILVTVIASAALFAVLYALFVASPIKLGYQRINLDLVDGEELLVKKLFSYFKINYFKSVALNLLYGLVTSLVVLIPALILVGSALGLAYDLLGQIFFGPEIVSFYDIDFSVISVYLPMLVVSIFLTLIGSVFSAILTYTYRFSYMILAEYPHMSAVEAMRVSRTMMKGHKWRLFCLDISFIGWFLLAACCTFGIGMIVVYPYREAAFAAFYDDLAHRSAAKETEFPSLDPDDYEADADESAEVKQPATDFGMPFTGDIEFPSLDLEDDAPTEGKDADAPKTDGEQQQ